MGRIKYRNSKDLIEAEEIKKRWQECTELYKKGLNDLDRVPYDYIMEVTGIFKGLDLVDRVPEEIWRGS